MEGRGGGLKGNWGLHRSGELNRQTKLSKLILILIKKEIFTELYQKYGIKCKPYKFFYPFYKHLQSPLPTATAAPSNR